MKLGLSIENLKVEDSTSITKYISDECMDYYVKSVIPDNSKLEKDIHNDIEIAKKLNFEKKIAYGLLIGGTVSCILGTKLPGPGIIYLSQEMQFKAPVFVGDTILSIVEVIENNSIKK